MSGGQGDVDFAVSQLFGQPGFVEVAKRKAYVLNTRFPRNGVEQSWALLARWSAF